MGPQDRPDKCAMLCRSELAWGGRHFEIKEMTRKIGRISILIEKIGKI